MDALTQLQEHVNAMCALFFTHVGVVQRDAPAAAADGATAQAAAAQTQPKQEAQPAGGAPPPKTEAQFRTEIEEMAAVVSQASGTVDALIEALPEMPPDSELDEQLRQAHAESEALEAELVKALGDAEDKLQRAREVYRRGTAHVEKKPRALGEE